jgi:hypothetical protein
VNSGRARRPREAEDPHAAEAPRSLVPRPSITVSRPLLGQSSQIRSIRARGYFDAPGLEEAREAVDRCEQVLTEFEAEALASELSDAEPAVSPRRLRAVDGSETG